MTSDDESRSKVTRLALPVLDSRNQSSLSFAARWRGVVVHACRVLLVGLLLVMLHRPSRLDSDVAQPPSIDAVLPLFPAASGVESEADSSGAWSVKAVDGSVVGRVARTMPQAANVRGYRGPTEAILVLDGNSKIQKVRLLDSLDTPEHVKAVREDAGFFEQFEGWQVNDPSSAQRVDGVSGATLTSLALAGGVLARLGAASGSLVFPEPLTQDEVDAIVAKSFASVDRPSAKVEADVANVVDGAKQPIGMVYRTGSRADNVIGFQGPSELLFVTANDGTLVLAEIRRSFDNEPYVDYVRTDRRFWKAFVGKPIDSLAQFDPVASGVEGVSGATMTSQAIADTVVAAAKKLAHERKLASQPKPNWLARIVKSVHVSVTEAATITLLFALAACLRLHLFRTKWSRTAWLLATIAVIGLWAGNLISLSLLAGWASGGVGWRIAPGLAILVFVSLLWPAATKNNVYCSHVCPHGALQQLIRPSRKSSRHWKLPGQFQRRLVYAPATILAFAFAGVLIWPTVDLASWEPFHAYLYPIASTATLVLAALSVGVSAVVPMAYCRFGCPTGSLLDYLRRSSASGRFGLGDAVALMLLVLAVAWSVA
jgi:NosR/NirI family transcriptional regulator, nitrous oxide reductase regulator